MKRRVPKHLLFVMRNKIPVDQLISEVLLLPCKNSEGFWRFLCPQCHEFRTAANKRTNLARCFLCKRNFNPIDIVMVVKGCDFLEAVDFLKRVLIKDQLLNQT